MSFENRSSLQAMGSVVTTVAWFAFFVVVFIAPLFGWDPFGDAYGRLFARHPFVIGGGTLILLGCSFFADWQRFRETGDDTFVRRAVGYGGGILLLAIVIGVVAIKNDI